MKRDLNDLSVDERKDYLLFKALTIEIPFSLLCIFSVLVAYPLAFSINGVYLPMYHFFIACLLIAVSFGVYFFYGNKYNKFWNL